MKKIFVLISALLTGLLTYAQPGAPFKRYNINHIQYPFNSFTQQYYIDSTTLESSYARLEAQPLLEELYIQLDHIPPALVSHGRYIKHIHLYNPRHDMSANDRWANPEQSLYDLELLNYFPSLEQVSVTGYRIEHRPDSVAKTLAKCTGTAVSVIDKTDEETTAFGMEHAMMIYPPSSSAGPAKAVLTMYDVVVVNFPSSLCIRSISPGKTIVTDPSGIQRNPYIKYVTLAGAPHSELPDWLPPSTEFISASDCDSLTSIQNLGSYKNLQSIIVHGCFNLKTFPKDLPVKKLQRLDVQLHPKYTPDLMAALKGIDTIGEMKLEFYQGIADIDFNDLSMHVCTLMVYGTALGELTEMRLANLQNLGAGAFHLAGKFSTIPDVSVLRCLNEFHFASYASITDNASMQTLVKIKNLTKFSLSNYRLPIFPEVFFEHNLQLTYIGLVGTGIKELSFGSTVLANLKHLYLRKNMELEKIPLKTFYPNAWKPDVHENRKKEYGY